MSTNKISAFDCDESVYTSDNKPTSTYTAVIGTTWTGEEAPYTQEIAVEGITTDDTPIVDVVISDDFETAQVEVNDWAKIYRITTGEGTLTVYATDVTEGELNIALKVVE